MRSLPRPARTILVLLAVVACLAAGAVAEAQAQTVNLPAPALPPPETPPAPTPTPATPAAPASPAPAPVPAPATPRAPSPESGTPVAPPVAAGPSPAERAAAERAATRRAAARRAARARALQATRARRAAVTALRTGIGPLPRYVRESAARLSATPTPAAEQGRGRLPVAAGVVLAALMAAFMGLLAFRRRAHRTPDGDTRQPREPDARARTRDSRVRHLIVTFGTTVAVLGLNLVTGVIIARALKPEGRGELTAIIGLPQTFAWLFALGSVQAISYHMARRPGDAPRLIGTWLSVLAPLGVIAVIVGELLVPVFLGAQTPSTVALAHVFMLLTLVSVLTNVGLGIVLGDGDFHFYNLVRVGQTLATALGYLVLLVMGRLTVESALVVAGAMIVATFAALSWRVLARHAVERPEKTLARATTGYGLRAHGSDLGGIGTVRLDLTIIPAFLGASLVGYYAVAATVAGIFITLAGSVAGVMLAMAAREHDDGPRIVLRATTALIAGCGCLAAVLWIVAPQAIDLVYGPEFAASVTPLRILLPGAVLFGAAAVVGQGLNALDRPFTAAVGQIIGLVITVTGLLIFLPVGGINAAAITSLVAYSAVFATTLLLYLREVRRRATGLREDDPHAPALVASRPPGRPGRRVPLHLTVARHAGVRATAVVLLVVAGAALVGLLLSRPGDARLAIAGVMFAAITGLGATSARLLVPTMIVWFAGLGLMRRLLTELVEPTKFDLLLLVGPSIVIALTVGTRSLRNPVRKSRLTNLVVVLAALTVFAAINPLNDSTVAGVAGLLFVLIPILAYWIGMRIDDATLTEALYLVGALSIVAALYGLYQTFSGFPSWDQHWIETSGYAALSVGTEIRAFSSFSSASEYAAYLAIGLTLAFVFLFRRARLFPVVLPVIALLGSALFFESSRGVVFKMVAALGLMIAARRGMRLGVAVTIALALVLLLPMAVSKIAPEDSSNSLVSHQVGGLADPTNEKTSTLTIHASIITDALRQSVTTPIGSGLSKVTIAGGRLGGAPIEEGGGAAAAETDIETAAVAMGLPGLLVFIAIFGLGIARLYDLAQNEPGFLSLAGLGVLTVTSLQWLNGGQYAVGILPWLVLGWAEARHLRRRAEAAERRRKHESTDISASARELLSAR